MASAIRPERPHKLPLVRQSLNTGRSAHASDQQHDQDDVDGGRPVIPRFILPTQFSIDGDFGESTTEDEGPPTPGNSDSRHFVDVARAALRGSYQDLSSRIQKDQVDLRSQRPRSVSFDHNDKRLSELAANVKVKEKKKKSRLGILLKFGTHSNNRSTEDSSDSEYGFDKSHRVSSPTEEGSHDRKYRKKIAQKPVVPNVGPVDYKSPNLARRLRDLVLPRSSLPSYTQPSVLSSEILPHPPLRMSKSSDPDIPRTHVDRVQVHVPRPAALSEGDCSRLLRVGPPQHRFSVEPSCVSPELDTTPVVYVYAFPEYEIQIRVDYEMYQIERYSSLLEQVADDCRKIGDVAQTQEVQATLGRVNCVASDAYELQQQGRMPRTGSVDDFLCSGSRRHDDGEDTSSSPATPSSPDIADSSSGNLTASSRRNTLPNLVNITAVFMKLRGAKKSRSSGGFGSGGSSSSLPGCCLGLVLECEVHAMKLTKGRAQHKFKTRHLMLFTDRLLLCRASKDQVKEQAPVNEVWTADPPADQQDAGQQLLLGWPLVNYAVRFESPEKKDLWAHVLKKTIERAREVDKPDTLTAKVVIDSKDMGAQAAGFGSSKCFPVGPTEDANTCLQKAMVAFKLNNEHPISGANARDYYFSVELDDFTPVKLLGHELPYWIIMWAVRRLRAQNGRRRSSDGGSSSPPVLASSPDHSGNLSGGESSVTAAAELFLAAHSGGNSMLLESGLDEQLRVKFYLRQKHRKELNSENDEGGKTRAKNRSRKGWGVLRPVSTKNKDEMDGNHVVEGNMFGRPLDELYPDGVLGHSLMTLLAMGYSRIPKLEGPFRVNGNTNHIKRLQEALDHSDPISSVATTSVFDSVDGSSSPPSSATLLGLLKKFLVSIPDLLMRKSLLHEWMAACKEVSEVQRLEAVRETISKLPAANRRLLELVVYLCCWVVQHCSVTKLTAENLSTSIGPSLISPLDGKDWEAQCELNKLVSFIITHFQSIWPRSDARESLEAVNLPMTAMDDSSVDSLDVDKDSSELDTKNKTMPSPSSLSRDSGLHNSDQHLFGEDFQELMPHPPPVPPRKKRIRPEPPSSSPPTTPPRSPSMSQPPPVPPKTLEAYQIRATQPSHQPPVIYSTDVPARRPRGGRRVSRPASVAAFPDRNRVSVEPRPMALPSYDEAVNRQIRLKLGAPLQDSHAPPRPKPSASIPVSTNHSKLRHSTDRSHSMDRRTHYHQPVHVTISNARLQQRLHQQQRQPVSSRTYENSEDSAAISAVASTVQSETDIGRNSRSRTRRRLPQELKGLLQTEEESYV